MAGKHLHPALKEGASRSWERPGNGVSPTASGKNQPCRPIADSGPAELADNKFVMRYVDFCYSSNRKLTELSNSNVTTGTVAEILKNIPLNKPNDTPPRPPLNMVSPIRSEGPVLSDAIVTDRHERLFPCKCYNNKWPREMNTVLGPRPRLG